MDSLPFDRPRVSRETRLLITTAALAALALLLLTRVRLADAPAESGPVPQLFASFGLPADFAALARQVSDVQAKVSDDLVALPLDSSTSPHVAWRVRDDLFTALLPADATLDGEVRLVARDAATGLSVVRIPNRVTTSAGARLASLESPGYVLGTVGSRTGVSLRPVFVSARLAIDVPLWPHGVFQLPTGVGVEAGMFVFTERGELVGLIAEHQRTAVLVSGQSLLQQLDAMLTRSTEAAGDFGVRVQTLTPALARATAATSGVIVSDVDPEGAAATRLEVGDVIEAVDGRAVPTMEHWRAYETRAAVGGRLLLRVRRAGVTEVVPLQPRAKEVVGAKPQARPPAPPGPGLGLRLRDVRGVGARVESLDASSSAGRAGLSVGDVITRVGGEVAPRAGRVIEMLGSMNPGSSLLVAVLRGDERFVTAIEP